MNLIKKSTATIALVALTSSIFTTGAYADNGAQVEAANALAAKGYINDHSDNESAYNLNQNVLRQEIAAVARGVAGLDKKSSCDNSFADTSATTPNTWACYSVEALLDAGLIAANDNFRPEAKISKAEAVGMMVKAAFGDEYSYDSSNSASWQEQVVAFAVSKGVVSSFSNYDTSATRGFVFEAGNNAIIASEEVSESCDEVSKLLGLCGDEEETTTEETTEETTTEETTEEETTEEETTTETPAASSDNVLSAELSADTPEGADLPEAVEGVSVLSFDVTAGSEDVSISGVELERVGFGEGAADKAAIYTDEGRASKVKSFSSSDDAVNLTFSPAVVVKAGETRTLTAKVNLHADNTGEFAVSVKNITASSTVEAATIVSNYFDVKSGVTAVDLTIAAQSVSTSVKTGEEQADLAKFKLTNGGLSSDTDITVSSITLKETGTVDQEEVLENLTLTVDGDVISTVASMEGKYVTFSFDPILIEDSKNETFTVKADIMGGAGDTVIFTLDDLIDVTATASKYNAVDMNGSFTSSTITLGAGELSIYAIDSTVDEVRPDQSNIVLGQIKVVNVAGKNLELKNLGVDLVSTSTGVLANLENVEFELNGTSYALDGDTSDTTDTTVNFSDTDVDVALPQGTTILTLRADTLKTATEDSEITMSLTVNSTNFSVKETEDDVSVSDITPSSLSWKKVTLIDSSATLAGTTVPAGTYVKGAADLVALNFDVKAGKASAITANEITVGLTSSGSASTKDEVAQVTLYKGSVSANNELAKVGGNDLASGAATFDGFEVEIGANATETFIVTVDTADTSAVENKIIVATLTGSNVTLEDDEGDSVTVSGTITGRNITVSGAGTLTLTADANNSDNEFTKTILAGSEATVFSADVKADNENVTAEKVTIVLTGATLKDTIGTAKLYLGDTLVASTSSSMDITDSSTSGSNTTIVFQDIVGLEFGTTQAELKLALDTNDIGKDKLGAAKSSVTVDSVAIAEAEGADSGETVTVTSLTSTSSKAFSIVPSTVTASVSNSFATDDRTAVLTFAVDSGTNTDTSGNALNVTLTGVILNVSSMTATGTVTIKNSAGTVIGTGSVTVDDKVTVSVSEVISNGESVTVETTAKALFSLKKDGIEYSSNSATYKMSLNANESMGEYTTSN